MSAFKNLEGKLASKGIKNPGALAAKIGNEKYGKATMQKAAARGVSARSIAHEGQKGHGHTGHSRYFPKKG